MSKYFKGGSLRDKKIADDLRKAADDYEDGAIIEARNTLVEIIRAIDEFTEAQDEAMV